MIKTNHTNNEPTGVQYARDVVSGKIVACEYIQLACERFLNDIERDDLIFDIPKVNRCVKFISLLKHFTGKSAGKPFILEPWQNFIVCNVIGLIVKSTGLRKYRTVYIEIARKNGKSAFAAALSLYLAVADGEAGAECDFCANSKEQAKIAFGFVQQYARQLDKKGKDIKILRDRIEIPSTASKMLVFSSEDGVADGYNSSAFVCDEAHAAKNSKMYDVLRSSQGMREQPISCVITTAGFLVGGFCHKLRGTAIEVLKGLKKDESNFAAIYTLDDESEIYDENCWIKANPNLGITTTKAYLREMVNAAENNTSEYVSTATKLFNQWLCSDTIWIPDKTIDSVIGNVNIDDFKDCECFCGIDLAAVSDITAVSYMFVRENDPKLYFYTDYYLPESALSESSSRELYKHWQRTGQLKVTSGNVTDYDVVLNDIQKVNEKVIIKKIAYDQWNSTLMVINATALGLPMEPYSQSIGNFNKPTREFERLIRSGGCVIDNSEVTRWMFRNVAMKTDHNFNVKPTKGKGKDGKIDGIISMVEALGIQLDTPKFTGSIFSV